jgi:putative membrane protein
MMWGYGYGSMWWMVVIQVLIAAAVIGAIAFAVILARRVESSDTGRGSPRAILEGRFARGEIDEQEYQRRTTLLSHP